MLEPATLSLLTDRRRHRPAGPGRRRARARRARTCVGDEELPPKATRALAEGDVVRVRTPGGGGYGEPEASPEAAD